jgi:hypothetical protein
VELPPNLAGPVHLEVLLPDALDLGLELGVAPGARCRLVGLVGVVGAGGTSRTRQIGSTPKRSRCPSIIRVTSSGDGRARPRKGARRLEDLISAAQLPDLTFQLGDALLLSRGHTWPLAGVDLGLAHPVAQRLTMNAELLGDPDDPARLPAGLLADLEHHPHGTVTKLLGILSRG